MLPERCRKKAQLRAACPLLEQEPRLGLKLAAIIRLMVRTHTHGRKRMDIELFFKYGYSKTDKLG